MVTKRNSPKILVFAVMLASSLVMATPVISATPDPTAAQPQVQVTAPPATPETKTVLASEPKNSEEPSKNGKTGKKKGRITGMMLALFALITGNHGASR